MTTLDAFSIAGRSAIVTGAASGLGLAIAEMLVEAGAAVTMLDLNLPALEEQHARLSRSGAVRIARLDVTDAAAQDAAIDAAAAAQGGLDILFANAGIDPGPGHAARDAEGRISPLNGIEHYEGARWLRVIDISLNGAFWSMRAAARHMRPRRRGSIIVTTSVSALRPAPAIGSAYAAAKAGAAQLVRATALDLAPDNVRVNAIAPGPFATAIGGNAMADPARRAQMAAGVPMGRVAEPDEIKALALYLASDASGFVTGQQIAIDGGASVTAARH